MVWSVWQHTAARNGAGSGVASTTEHHDGFVYGAQDPKLGEIIMQDMTPQQRKKLGNPSYKKLAQLGKQSRERIEQQVPGLVRFVESAKKAHKRGFLKGLDGRIIASPSEKSAPNTINQSAGAIIMKRAQIIADDLGRESYGEYDWEFVLTVHDEYQAESPTDIAEGLGEVFSDSIRQAGEYYKLRVPLAGESAVGMRWSETH